MPLAHRVFTADSELAVDLLNHGADQHSSAAWVTAAVSASDIINAMLSATSFDPVEWVLAQIDKDEDLQSLFREKRQEMLRSGPPTLGQPPSIFSQPTLTHLWQTRFDVLRQYGAEVYRKQPSRIDNILHSVLHMHHNRLIGIDPDSERSMYAACRGWAQIQQGRRQAGL
jgi:thiopeptide-type bacteriocin biosynthesis protein